MNDDFNTENTNDSISQLIIEEKTPNGVTRAELEAYIGFKDHPHYSKAIDKYMKNPNSICFNWSAFFFGLYWLLFRKAFVPALMLFAFSFASLVFIPYPISLFVSMALLFGLALWGSSIYLKVAEANILKAKNRFSDIVETDDFKGLLFRLGGTSFLLPIILFIGQNLLL